MYAESSLYCLAGIASGLGSLVRSIEDSLIIYHRRSGLAGHATSPLRV